VSSFYQLLCLTPEILDLAAGCATGSFAGAVTLA
jgi:hypothetical protein